MAVLYNETWTGTTGAAWGSQWTIAQVGGTNGGATIQSNAGRLTTPSSGTYCTTRAYLSGMSTTTNSDVTVTFTVTTQAESYPVLSINSDGVALSSDAGYSQNGYFLSIHIANTASAGALELTRTKSNVQTILQTTSARTYTAGVAYKARLQRIGTLVQGKVWAASGSEPSTWDITLTESSANQPAAGRTGLTYQSGNVAANRVVTWDDLTVTDGVAVQLASGSAALTGSGSLGATGAASVVTTTPALTKGAGNALLVNGTAIRLSGANAYWVGLDDNNGANVFPSQTQIANAFAGMKTMGGNIARAHTVGMSAGTSNSFETAPGVFNNANMDSADYAVYQAGLKGIYLMVPLTDQWNYYHGGKWNFVHWAYQQNPSGITDVNGTVKGDSNEDQFYANTTAGLRIRALFKAYITAWMNHVNPYTGLAYKDDPTIAIVETGNELYSATAEWTNDIAQYIKSLAPNKLVADGSAAGGLTVASAPGLSSTYVDIMGGHYYAQNGAPNWETIGFTTKPSRYGSTTSFIDQMNADAAAATSAGKAFIVGEYPWTRSDVASYYAAVEANANIDGDMYWTFVANTTAGVPETHGGAFGSDDYSVHYPYADSNEQAYAPALATHITKMVNPAVYTAPANLIASLVIEHASSATPFTIGGGSLSVDTSVFQEGGSSLKVTPANNDYPYWYGSTASQWAPVTPGSQYTGVASIRKNTATTTGYHAVLLWANSAGSVLSNSAGAFTSGVNGQWVQVTATGTAPANAAYAVLQVQADSAHASTDTFNVDQYGIFAGTNTTWTASDVAPVYTASPATSGSGTLSIAAQVAATGSVTLTGTGTLTAAAKLSVSRTAALTGSGTLSTPANRVAGVGSAAFSGAGVVTLPSVSAGGPDLTVTGTPNFAPGVFGNAYFPNGGQYAYTNDFGTNQPIITVEGWAQVGAAGTARTWFTTNTAVNSLRVQMGANTSNVLQLVLGTLVTTAGTAMSQGWHHFAAQLVSGRWRVYMDGVQVYTVSGSSNTFNWAGGFTIGRSSTGTQQWPGGIDEVRISNVERYPLGTTFTPPSAPFTADANTVALYHFDADGVSGDVQSAGIPNIVTPVSLTGNGELGASGFSASQINFTGSGDLSAVQNNLTVSGAPAFGGAGTLATALRTPRATGTADFTGSGSLIAAAIANANAAVNLTGTGSLDSGGGFSGTGSINFAGSGVLGASTSSGGGSTINLGAEGGLSIGTSTKVSVGVTLTGSGGLALTPIITASGTAGFSGNGSLGNTGTPSGIGAATFTGSGTLNGGATNPVAFNQAAFTGAGDLSAQLKSSAVANVSLGGSGSLASVRALRISSAAAFTGLGVLGGFGLVTAQDHVYFGGTGGLIVRGRIAQRIDAFTNGVHPTRAFYGDRDVLAIYYGEALVL